MVQPSKKAEVSTAQTKEATPQVEAKVLPINPPNKRENQPLSIGQILEKFNQQAKRIDKLEKLNQTTKNLDSFKLGSDTIKDTLTIEDGERNEFTTHNSEIITKVIDMIKAEVAEKMSETEAEIQSNLI